MCRRVTFPAPHLSDLWIYSLADPFKAKLLQNTRRGVSFRQRVSPHPDSCKAFREFHKSRRHRTCMTSTLKGGNVKYAISTTPSASGGAVKPQVPIMI